MQEMRPAWSSQFAREKRENIDLIQPLDTISWDEACGNGTGKGIKVAIIDSGIDASHPALAGPVDGYITVEMHDEEVHYVAEPHEDACGHGTACAGIIRSLAPECEIYSVKVLGRGLMGRGNTFIAGLRWAVENNMDVCNLSLGTTKKVFFSALHEVADLAYFKNVILVTAANNMPIESFPSMYASVISVASHNEQEDATRFYYNPAPPIEFGAPGINVRVAWLEQKWITATGNSFAAPHITGIAAKILSMHRDLTPFQVKTILRALSANAQERPGK